MWPNTRSHQGFQAFCIGFSFMIAREFEADQIAAERGQAA